MRRSSALLLALACLGLLLAAVGAQQAAPVAADGHAHDEHGTNATAAPAGATADPHAGHDHDEPASSANSTAAVAAAAADPHDHAHEAAHDHAAEAATAAATDAHDHAAEEEAGGSHAGHSHGVSLNDYCESPLPAACRRGADRESLRAGLCAHACARAPPPR